MALDKLKHTNLPQRIRALILGSEKPNFMIRMSVLGGLLVWIYFFSWHLITFLSLTLLDNLKQATNVRAAYGRIGYQYGYSDTINRLTLYAALEILVYIVIFIALILIYRKKRTGIILYLITTVTGLLITFFVMGFRFMKVEISILDYILILASFIYFALGFLLFYRKPIQPID